MKATEELWPILETEGEDVVRQKLTDGVYGPASIQIVKAWLAAKEAQRAEEAQREQRPLDHEALRLAQEANRISAYANQLAARANHIAWFAVVVALLAAAIALLHR